jgi:DNA ligase (NAD+)
MEREIFGDGHGDAGGKDALEKFLSIDREITRHNGLYYGENAPEISDFTYDQLKAEWETMLAAHPRWIIHSQQSPIGDDRRRGFSKMQHRIPMLSLSNTYGREDVSAFIRNVRNCVGDSVTFAVEPKVDGLAISLIYDGGRLRHAITRGNGVEGDDVTRNVLNIENLPKEIPHIAPLEVRGEIYISLEDFARINEGRSRDGLDPFANARNLAAGSLKLLNPDRARERHLQFIAYEMGIYGENFPDHVAVLGAIASLGIPTNGHWLADGDGAVWDAIVRCREGRSRYAFAIDGAVIKVNGHVHRDRLGSIASAPRWAIAYKYAPDRATTRLLAIKLQVGRTGIVAPVAHLEPVELAGSTIQRATLHNGDEIARHDIREGDTVTVEKAGEVIPAIVAVDVHLRPDSSQPFIYPSHCPACEEPLYRFDGEVAWRCINPNCPPQIIRRLEHFASKGAMDIHSLGGQRIALFHGAGLLDRFSDIYRLHAAPLENFPKLGKKSVQGLLLAIEASKERPLWRLLHGLGIPHVGAQVAKLLEKKWPTMEMIMGATLENLQNCDTIGGTIAESITSFFRSDSNRQLIDELASLGVSMGNATDPSEIRAPSPFSGKSFVITGSFQAFTREELREEIERRGGTVRSAVSKNIHGLIVGAGAGGKLVEARRLGVETVDEAHLHRLLSESTDKE